MNKSLCFQRRIEPSLYPTYNTRSRINPFIFIWLLHVFFIIYMWISQNEYSFICIPINWLMAAIFVWRRILKLCLQTFMENGISEAYISIHLKIVKHNSIFYIRYIIQNSIIRNFFWPFLEIKRWNFISSHLHLQLQVLLLFYLKRANKILKFVINQKCMKCKDYVKAFLLS